MHHNDLAAGGGREKGGGRGGGQARELRTGGDEVTPGELITGKWNKNKNKKHGEQTDTVPLPEHLGERGVAVIRPGGRRGAGEGRAGRGKG